MVTGDPTSAQIINMKVPVETSVTTLAVAVTLSPTLGLRSQGEFELLRASCFLAPHSDFVSDFFFSVWVQFYPLASRLCLGFGYDSQCWARSVQKWSFSQCIRSLQISTGDST